MPNRPQASHHAHAPPHLPHPKSLRPYYPLGGPTPGLLWLPQEPGAPSAAAQRPRSVHRRVPGADQVLQDGSLPFRSHNPHHPVWRHHTLCGHSARRPGRSHWPDGRTIVLPPVQGHSEQTEADCTDPRAGCTQWRGHRPLLQPLIQDRGGLGCRCCRTAGVAHPSTRPLVQ